MASLPRRGLYPLEDTEGARQEVRDQFQRVLAPLAFFPAAYTRLRSSFRKELPLPDAAPAEKPVPVPISLAALLQLVQRRLELGPSWAHLPSRPQAAFRGIILAEVRHIFKDLQRSLHDQAFGAQTNRELYQHLVAYIGLVSQHLFLHYLCLLEHRSKMGVFTDCANLTRFSAQLTLDCSAFLNVAAVRHRLVMEMKTARSRRPESARRDLVPLAQVPKETLGCRLGFTISHFIRLTKPLVPTARKKVAEEVKELENLPSLDMNKVKQLNLPTAKEISFLKKMTCAAVRVPCPSASREKMKPQRIKRTTSGLKRSQSLPNMRAGRLLADELGIHIRPRRLSPDLPCHYADSAEDWELRGSERLDEDLQRLVQGCIVKSSPGQGKQNDDLELPPLIKALTRRKANELHEEHLQTTLSALQREEYVERERRNTIIAAPASHPQAATINVQVHDRMVVKAADLQVSDRVFLEAVVLEKCPPIYNHLLGEINDATLKSLDANLSTGEEVREMYKELMNTISEDHLKFDAGPLIESPAVDIDLSGCFASSTLTRRKNEQVINDELSKILPAGPYSPEEVVDTPQTPNLPFKKKSSKKEYASWLKWWKKTFNTDDYLTYIATKESDYLAVIFHLYNFVGEEEEEEKMQQAAVDEAEVRAQEKAKRAAIKEALGLPRKEDKIESGHSEGIAMERVSTPDVVEDVRLWQGGLGTLGDSDHKPEDLRALQRRLERLWVVLHFSERERMDMAIKYSSHPYYLLLPDMLQAWEEAARSIQDRELLLAELEKFELTASDPNRLFSLEPQAYARRMQEGATRNRLRSELAQYDSELYVILTHIREAFNDTVTFKGRPYLKKMEWDTVEMLYWLQQERRASAMSTAVYRGSPGRKLPPLG
ncbi:coiled-coil domain-containing protein 87 [Pogona vitticeps]